MRALLRIATCLAIVLSAALLVPGQAGAAPSPVDPDNRPTTIPGATNGYVPATKLTTIDAHCRIASGAAFAMRSMMAAALAQGVNLFPEECYRSYAGQVYQRNRWCAVGKCSMAAVPGTSNHGWGKAVDFRDQNGELTFTSGGYRWLKNNAARFGFNHPRSVATSEAWHWEWVGDGGKRYPNHPMPAPANAPSGRVSRAYWTAGGPYALGSLRNGEHRDAAGTGSVITYTSGALFFPDNGSPAAVVGGIWTEYAALGNVRSWLGYPTSNQFAAADQMGRQARFQHGEILWSPSTGGHALAGSVLNLWSSSGGYRSALGYPLDSGTPVGDGTGTKTRFENGHIWSGSGVATLATVGSIDQRYTGVGGPRGFLGYPTSAARFVPGAVIQHFVGGTIIATSRGAYGFAPGPQLDLYWLLGGPSGKLGAPVSGQVRTGQTTSSNFAHGSISVDLGVGISTIWSNNGHSSNTTGIVTAQGWVDHVYRALFNRPADSNGRAYWAARIQAGEPTWHVAETLAATAEAKGFELDQLFRRALGRGIDPRGRAYWVARMQGGMSWLQVESLIYGSPEWFRTHGGTNTSFVTAVYQALLGRTVDPGGLDYWVQQLDRGMSRTSLVGGLVRSFENRRQVVNAEFQRVLGRNAGATGVAYWSGWLGQRQSDPARLDANLLTSWEAVRRVGAR